MTETIQGTNIPSSPFFLQRVRERDSFCQPVQISPDKTEFRINPKLDGYSGMSNSDWINGFTLVTEKETEDQTGIFIVEMVLGQTKRHEGLEPDAQEVIIPTLEIVVKRDTNSRAPIDQPNNVKEPTRCGDFQYELTELDCSNAYPPWNQHPKVTLHRRRRNGNGEIIGMNSPINLGYSHNNCREGLALLLKDNNTASDRYISFTQTGDVVYEDKDTNEQTDKPLSPEGVLQ